MRTLGLGEAASHSLGAHVPQPFYPLPVLTSGGPGEPAGGPGAVLCCCFSSSICCREKKGRRREGGSSGWRRPHSSKLLACRQRTCSRRFFLCRVLKWQYSQAKGLAPAGTSGGILGIARPLGEPFCDPKDPLQLTDSQHHAPKRRESTLCPCWWAGQRPARSPSALTAFLRAPSSRSRDHTPLSRLASPQGAGNLAEGTPGSLSLAFPRVPARGPGTKKRQLLPPIFYGFLW